MLLVPVEMDEQPLASVQSPRVEEATESAKAAILLVSRGIVATTSKRPDEPEFTLISQSPP